MMASTATVSPEGDTRRVTLRNDRYKALRSLWRFDFVREELPSVYGCHHHSIMPGGGVDLFVTPTPEGPRAGLRGLAHCGSVWVCPVCSAAVAARRADEIRQAVEKWQADDGKVALLTLTRPHERGDDLDQMWFGNSAGWKAVLASTSWYADQDAYGTPWTRVVTHGARKGETVTENRIPWVRATEVTIGRNGFHPHMHVLLFLRGDVDLDSLAESMFGRWCNGLEAAGQPLPSFEHGFDVRWIDQRAGGEAFGDYFAKSVYSPARSAGFEVAGGQQKSGRKGSRTPFELLANVVDNRKKDGTIETVKARRDYGLFREYAIASKGKRQLTWSRGLRDWAGLGVEQTDESIASEDLRTAESVRLAHYVNSQWAKIREAIGEELHRGEVEYETDFAPLIKDHPEFVDQWNASWFDEKLTPGLVETGRRKGQRKVGRIGVDRESARPRSGPPPSDDLDLACGGCGEKMDPLIAKHGRHLGCFDDIMG